MENEPFTPSKNGGCFSIIAVAILLAVVAGKFGSCGSGTGGGPGGPPAAVSSNGSSSSRGAGTKTQHPPLCPTPGPLTGALVPSFDPSEITTIRNPCLAFAGLLAQVTDLIPLPDRTRVGEFINGVDTVANRVAKLNDVVECAYENDRLSIVLYQDRSFRWSIGVVAVLRGTFDAVAETSACFLLRQLMIPLVKRRQPAPAFCFTANSLRKSRETYSVLWLASSDRMCADLAFWFRSDVAQPLHPTHGRIAPADLTPRLPQNGA